MSKGREEALTAILARIRETYFKSKDINDVTSLKARADFTTAQHLIEKVHQAMTIAGNEELALYARLGQLQYLLGYVEGLQLDMDISIENVAVAQYAKESIRLERQKLRALNSVDDESPLLKGDSHGINQ